MSLLKVYLGSAFPFAFMLEYATLRFVVKDVVACIQAGIRPFWIGSSALAAYPVSFSHCCGIGYVVLMLVWWGNC